MLTAGHVIGAIKAKEHILVLPAQHGEEVTWIRIEGEGMEGCGETNNRPRGPDLAYPVNAHDRYM